MSETDWPFMRARAASLATVVVLPTPEAPTIATIRRPSAFSFQGASVTTSAIAARSLLAGVLPRPSLAQRCGSRPLGLDADARTQPETRLSRFGCGARSSSAARMRASSNASADAAFARSDVSERTSVRISARSVSTSTFAWTDDSSAASAPYTDAENGRTAPRSFVWSWIGCPCS